MDPGVTALLRVGLFNMVYRHRRLWERSTLMVQS